MTEDRAYYEPWTPKMLGQGKPIDVLLDWHNGALSLTQACHLLGVRPATLKMMERDVFGEKAEVVWGTQMELLSTAAELEPLAAEGD